MANKTDLEIKRGSTYETDLIATTEDGVAVNLTGWKIRFMVKRNITDGDGQALLDVSLSTFTDPTNGKTTFSIPAATTAQLPAGTFVYAYQVIDATGNVAESQSGQCIVTPDVIQAVS